MRLEWLLSKPVLLAGVATESWCSLLRGSPVGGVPTKEVTLIEWLATEGCCYQIQGTGEFSTKFEDANSHIPCQDWGIGARGMGAP